jgi:DNA-directed RNA polymerase subunit RPC12/RpoP
MNLKKLPKIDQGSPCPHCGAHAFEMLPPEHGMTIMKCLKCNGKVIA